MRTNCLIGDLSTKPSQNRHILRGAQGYILKFVNRLLFQPCWRHQFGCGGGVYAATPAGTVIYQMFCPLRHGVIAIARLHRL